MSRKVLVLNADYTPLCVISWKKSITLLYKEDEHFQVNVVKYYENKVIKTSSGDIPAPAIIAISEYIDKDKIKVKLSKRNIIIRDNRICQYCGIELDRSSSTMDHVEPKSKFSDKAQAHSWTNLVLACRSCNRKKADRSLNHLQDMELLKQPRKPSYQAKFVYGLSPWDSIPSEWNDFVK